ncbi:glycoside hydrolase family protein [Halobellus captivus]|uniref:hypothetical protein n=1 Tax=Halobellus captivus TaxID=2592614 RepID=UPI0011A7D648|nr:hypothetical protein [Halobellus captivus]
MSWNKLGRIFEPTETFDWMETHAQLPTPLHLSGDRYRVFFAGRNEDNMSQTGFVDIDISDPTNPLRVSKEPVLKLGSLGMFDDSGVYPSSVVQIGEETHLYYIGWMQGKRVSYYACVGLGVSTDGGETFEKRSRGPHLARNDVDPYMTLSSDVEVVDGMFRMWYTSATGWVDYETGVRPNYHIKYAESDDGLTWTREGTIAIDYEHDGEWAIARPCVRQTEDGFEMWYSYATDNHGYRIGYATSADGLNWTRYDDQTGISISDDGWDSDLQAYPYVIEHDEAEYMFYNGNDYGREGFGLAQRT